MDHFHEAVVLFLELNSICPHSLLLHLEYSAKLLLLCSTDESHTGLTHEAKQMMTIFSFRLTIYVHVHNFTIVVLSKALQVTLRDFFLCKMHCKSP